MRTICAINSAMSPDVLRKAILAAPKTHGWKTRLGREAGVSRQRITQLWNRLRGLCLKCGREAVPGRSMCNKCGVKNRKRLRRIDGYKGTKRGREQVYL